MATRFGILSTFPPTQCGLATFSSALATHLIEAGADVSVVRLVDSLQPPVPLVSHQLVTGAPDEARAAAAALNACDVALVQHEYGIYGGPDGDDVLDVLARRPRAGHRGAAHRARPPDAAPAGGARARGRARPSVR